MSNLRPVGAGVGAVGQGLAAKPKVVTTSGQQIVFAGSLAAGKKSEAHSFTVLPSENAPTVTGGFAKINIVDRPQDVGLTIVGGYDPIAMDIAVRFDCVTADWFDSIQGSTNQPASDVERDIGILEWMGGRGKQFGVDRVGAPGQGDPPVVRVYSVDSQGVQRPLIPNIAQDVPFLVSNIVYDTNPARNARGYRTRQDVTVSLTQLVQDQFSGSASSSSARAQARGALGAQYKVVTTTSGLSTIRKIAGQVAHDPNAGWAILAANKGNPRIGTSIDKLLPAGMKIKVPTAVIQVPATPVSLVS